MVAYGDHSFGSGYLSRNDLIPQGLAACVPEIAVKYLALVKGDIVSGIGVLYSFKSFVRNMIVLHTRKDNNVPAAVHTYDMLGYICHCGTVIGAYHLKAAHGQIKGHSRLAAFLYALHKAVGLLLVSLCIISKWSKDNTVQLIKICQIENIKLAQQIISVIMLGIYQRTEHCNIISVHIASAENAVHYTLLIY